MPQELRDLIIDEVSVVDRPANSSIDPKTGRKVPHATIAIWKRDDGESARADRLRAVQDRLNTIEQGIGEVRKGLAANRQCLAARLAEARKENTMEDFERVLKTGSREQIVAVVRKRAEQVAKQKGISVEAAEALVWKAGAQAAYEHSPKPTEPKKPERKTFRCTKAEAELDRLARVRLRKSPGRSYAQCCSDVLTERPELYKQYQEELASGRTYVVPEPQFEDASKSDLSRLRDAANEDDEEEATACPSCKAEVEDGDAFCRHCGRELN